jgi:hypothetical protein
MRRDRGLLWIVLSNEILRGCGLSVVGVHSPNSTAEIYVSRDDYKKLLLDAQKEQPKTPNVF